MNTNLVVVSPLEQKTSRLCPFWKEGDICRAHEITLKLYGTELPPRQNCTHQPWISDDGKRGKPDGTDWEGCAIFNNMKTHFELEQIRILNEMPDWDEMRKQWGIER